MKTKVFISCGQKDRNEVLVASKIKNLLAKRGFEPYVAKEVQNVFEINSGIVKELKNSDCYLFVNFRREKIGRRKFRGSLFSNQEFAMAYVLDFDRIIVVNQTDIQPEGMLAYIGCNTDQFAEVKDCVSTVKKALDRAHWQPDFSRRLRVGSVTFSDRVGYSDGRTVFDGRILRLEIQNGRTDTAALEATARLNSFREVDQKTRIPSEIRSPLKATGKPAYSHTIFPKSSEAFDVLCIGESSDAPGLQAIYLNSALDLLPKPRLPITPGTWELEYEFYAIGFPLLAVTIELTWPTNGQPSSRILSEDIS